MKFKLIAGVLILGGVAVAAEGCDPPPSQDGRPCSDGRGHWVEDESGRLSGKYSGDDYVVVRICVDDGGNVIDMEVE